jgi:hypothetical protein
MASWTVLGELHKRFLVNWVNKNPLMTSVCSLEMLLIPMLAMDTKLLLMNRFYMDQQVNSQVKTNGCNSWY